MPRAPLAETVAMLRLLSRLGSDLVTSIARRRFPFEELLLQTWYTIRVCTLPALMVSIPFGVILALQVGVLAQQVGAVSFTGAGNTLAVVRQASPIITALMLSGVAGSAICSDIGARKIREELDALEVMGISVTERLILPRALSHRHRRRPAQRRGHVLHDHDHAADQHRRDEPLARLLPRLGRHPRAALRPAALADQGGRLRRDLHGRRRPQGHDTSPRDRPASATP